VSVVYGRYEIISIKIDLLQFTYITEQLTYLNEKNMTIIASDTDWQGASDFNYGHQLIKIKVQNE
jgi:hypothetical protein